MSQATGIFVVNFTTALPAANYVAIGSAGTPNGSVYVAGDDNLISFGQNTYAGLRTTQSIRGFSTNSAGTGLENTQQISVTVFA